MGTVVNGVAILLGGFLGMLIRRGLPQKIEEMAMKLLGVSVFVVGIEGVITSMVTADGTGALASAGSLLLIVSLVVGGVLGELLDIDGALMRGGKKIEEKFGKEGFAKGFISASLIFCVGAMAIMGGLYDGLGDPSVLYIKSALDFTCAVILGSTLGFGVLFSCIPVVVYQGAIALAAHWLEPLMREGPLKASLCMVGYVIVMLIGTNFLGWTTIRTANLLPALLGPALYTMLLPVFARISQSLPALF